MLQVDHKDLQLLEALERAGSQQDFCRVLDWLRLSLVNKRRENDALDGINLYRSQGCCMTLQSIITAVEDSGETLRRMRSINR